MSVVINKVRSGFYLDSVALMRMSVQLERLEGVESASMMIATPSNRQILNDAGLLTDDSATAGGDDLLIALRVRDASLTEQVLEQANALLTDGPATQATQQQRPVTFDQAISELPGANLALISVPGDFAAREASEALQRGLNVMIFSDNVSVDAERHIKTLADERGLLVMGPDCGTAIINGIPLAFANQLPRGDVGIVAASGTGLQEVACLLARAGRGISQAIGTGGRDTSDAIGGLTTLAAIDWLAKDPATEHIVVISKPPGAVTVNRVLDALKVAGKPATVCFIGADTSSLNATPMIQFCRTLSQTAQAVCKELTLTPVSAGASSRRGSLVHGLFAGGTLCAEAQLVFKDNDGAFFSNVPIEKNHDTGSITARGNHCLLDLGADEYTRGRPHPMLEPQVRSSVLRDSLLNKDVAVVLLDVVLGFGSHADPAAAVIETIAQCAAQAVDHDLPLVVASVCGTDADPQSRQQQVQALTQAGVIVADSNAMASQFAVERVS